MPDHGPVNRIPRPNPPPSSGLPSGVNPDIYNSFVLASSIVPVDMEWVWYPFLPIGSITLLEGNPGVGKSTITCALAADLSRGRALPGDAARPPMRIAMLSTEDLAEAVIIKRLQAHDADLDRIHVSNRSFTLNRESIATLTYLIREMDVTVILLDPLMSYIGGRVDVYRANETRAAMEPLAEMAQASGTAVLMVRHLRKNQEGDRRMSGYGSIDFYAHARSIIQIDEPKGGDTLIHNIKASYAKPGTRIEYSIADDTRLVWGKYFRPGEGLKVSRVSRRAGEYQDWLRKQLEGGPKTTAELEERATLDGLLWGAIRNSAQGVAYCYKGKGKAGGWWWTLEEPPVTNGHASPDDLPEHDIAAHVAAAKAKMAQRNKQ